jgi:hypothetical protein
LIIEADAKVLIQGASPNPVTHGTNLTYTLAVYNNGPDVSKSLIESPATVLCAPFREPPSKFSSVVLRLTADCGATF